MSGILGWVWFAGVIAGLIYLAALAWFVVTYALGAYREWSRK